MNIMSLQLHADIAIAGKLSDPQMPHDQILVSYGSGDIPQATLSYFGDIGFVFVYHGGIYHSKDDEPPEVSELFFAMPLGEGALIDFLTGGKTLRQILAGSLVIKMMEGVENVGKVQTLKSDDWVWARLPSQLAKFNMSMETARVIIQNTKINSGRIPLLKNTL
jgi:hypothetical protein